MDRKEAERLLEDAEVVPVLQANLNEAKELLEACLAADVPALLGRDDHCVKGCAPKLLLLARVEDAPRIAGILRQRFGTLLAQEGTLSRTPPPAEARSADEPLPCPACGTPVPDEAPECPDCGLTL